MEYIYIYPLHQKQLTSLDSTMGLTGLMTWIEKVVSNVKRNVDFLNTKMNIFISYLNGIVIKVKDTVLLICDSFSSLTQKFVEIYTFTVKLWRNVIKP